MINTLKGKKSIKEILKDMFFYVVLFFVINIFVEARVNDKLVEYNLKSTNETTSFYKKIFSEK